MPTWYIFSVRRCAPSELFIFNQKSGRSGLKTGWNHGKYRLSLGSTVAGCQWKSSNSTVVSVKQLTDGGDAYVAFLYLFFFFNFGRCSVVCAHPSSLEDFPSPAFVWSSGRVRRHCEQTTRVGLSRLALLSFTSRDGNPTADCWDWGRWPNDKRDQWCSMQTVLLQFYVNQLWFDNNDWTFAGWWNSRVRFRPRPLKHGLFHPFK